jgi:hypothetical protein
MLTICLAAAPWSNSPAADWRLLPMSKDCIGLEPSPSTSEVRPLREAENAEVIVPYMLPAVMPAGKVVRAW